MPFVLLEAFEDFSNFPSDLNSYQHLLVLTSVFCLPGGALVDTGRHPGRGVFYVKEPR